ncbi:nuclear lim interactor-interacting factor [Trypanosoma theileri]|uniref:Mitochondrial import inner membrane translocase subunit TIM50 n=1 Tax=Trypanosoma theileri TaxID=67003 RepID=A0A1X0PA23_9TRYP|nr:nuclear lim interactor-interacting factor [Trypanosoma theileri]ORC93449.1 nuclear lim interactor-interacting factor [Trypanosoma theileri]
MHGRHLDYSSTFHSRYAPPKKRTFSARSSHPCYVAERPAAANISSLAVRGTNRRYQGKEFFSQTSNLVVERPVHFGSTVSLPLSSENGKFSSTYRSRDEYHVNPRYRMDWRFSKEQNFSPRPPPVKTFARSNFTDSDNFFIPPPSVHDEGKLVVVLDLDETLVYSRGGPIIPRPGTHRLFEALRGRCEVVVWTAGEEHYAREVIQRIDRRRCIQHCIFRHEKWWSERPGYLKDISALGRPLNRTIIIDNTPDCLRAYPQNGLLVTDFRGELWNRSGADTTLFVLADIIEDVLRGPLVSVEAFHSHPYIQLRSIPCDTGGSIEVLTLKQDQFANARPPRSRFVAAYQLLKASRQ